MTQPKATKATKGKVVLGYLVLFLIAAVSVWFVYSEILKIVGPEKEATEDNQKIIQISNAIAGLYAAEAVGRNSILTGSERELDAYNRMLDSVNVQIDGIKQHSDRAQLGKFDTIQDLLRRKRASISEIISFRKAYDEKNTFDRAVGQITRVKDSLNRRVKPIQFRNNTQMRQFLNSVLTKKQMDSLSKLPVSNEQLTSAIEKMLTQVIIRDNRMKYELFKKEQKLQDENRVLSDRLRVVLSALEKEILQNSYAKINASKQAVAHTINTIAWIGAASFLLLIVFAAIILRDLTQAQRYRQQLEQLNDEKEDLLRSKTMLLATVTHDLQTPLGSVIGFSDLLAKTGLDDRQRNYLESIKLSSHYILKLVNDLLDFSKLENNRISIEHVAFNFRTLVEGICQPLEHNALSKGIELRCDVDESLDANFVSDPYRIKQVLTNLISNAIKFTQEGSVEVVARLEAKTITVAVLDTGIGIARDQQDAVFKEFTQAHSGIEKQFGGTGLGLTIAKRMLRLLGGDIKLESEVGQGSIFTVNLPAVEAELPEVELPLAQLDTDFLINKKILIVDDDTTQLSLMRELFNGHPAEVITVSDPGKVRELLEAQPFDLVLTDVQMPQMDGFALVRIIRNNNDPAIAGIPVLALSGKRDLDERDFTDKGFTGFHPKPLQWDELLLQMRAIFAHRKPISVKPVAVEIREDAPLFNLESLGQFTQDDPEALKLIIDNFIDSTRENCAQLLVAAERNDLDQLSAVAHRMIPMLRQLEVSSIYTLLEPLEERSLELSTAARVEYVQSIIGKIKELTRQLELEVS